MPNHQFTVYLEKREDELVKGRNEGAISDQEFNAEMKALREEERDAYEADRQDALDRVNDEWGYR